MQGTSPGRARRLRPWPGRRRWRGQRPTPAATDVDVASPDLQGAIRCGGVLPSSLRTERAHGVMTSSGSPAGRLSRSRPEDQRQLTQGEDRPAAYSVTGRSPRKATRAWRTAGSLAVALVAGRKIGTRIDRDRLTTDASHRQRSGAYGRPAPGRPVRAPRGG